MAFNPIRVKKINVVGSTSSPHKKTQLCALLLKLLRNMTADKSGCTCDEYFQESVTIVS